MAERFSQQQQSHDHFAVLVLGMHRSGTSAVTRVVNLLGAELSKKLLPPSPGENETGFWESWQLYDLQEELLASAGSSWEDWRPLDSNWLENPTARPIVDRIIEHVQDDFAGSPLFAIKDPRNCRLMPLWREVLEKLGASPRVLLPVRNPLEVAESLRKRNGISLPRGYLIWLRHVLDAEYNSRSIPRLVFSYNSLLQDWKAFASQSAQALGISWPADSAETAAQIDEFLQSGSKHHTFDETQLAADPSVSAWVKDAYTALNMLMESPESQTAFTMLDKIRCEFDQAGIIFGEILAEEEFSSAQLQSNLANDENTCKRCDKQQAKINDLERRQSQLQDDKSQLRASYAALQTELKSAQSAFCRKSDASFNLQSELDAAQIALRKKSAEYTSMRDELAASKARQQTARSALVSQLENEKALTELYASERKDLLSRLNRIQASSTWRLARPIFTIETRSSWLAKWLSVSSVVLRGLLVLQPIKYWRSYKEAEVVENSGLFDSDWYIESNTDVVLDGVAPLQHWLSKGWIEGRKPNPYFDTQWYIQQYLSSSNNSPNPLLHYIREYSNADLEPNPDFDTKKYLLQHPEVGNSGANPLSHFLSHHVESQQA
ncbi:Uncharacterised protein [Halioglobus japonicus]|nr:Uncharacterised protein [Halioglobus japonicus]